MHFTQCEYLHLFNEEQSSVKSLRSILSIENERECRCVTVCHLKIQMIEVLFDHHYLSVINIILFFFHYYGIFVFRYVKFVIILTLAVKN